MLKTTFILSFIAATRFFGLFIVLPVLSLYALDLKGANVFLVSVLVGIYALTQMLFQVPFGILSDKIGRKKTMLLGLLIFIIGSLICAISTDIYTMILGRLLQGSGAIGAVASAMISDFVSEEKRSKAMAVMGMFIGLAFAASMVISPLMSAKFGLSSLFYLSAILTLLCIILLFTAVPKEVKISHYQANKTSFFHFLKEKNLALMNLTNFMQKMLMTLTFIIIPLIIVKRFGIFSEDELYKVYILAMIAGFVAMGLAGALGSKKGLSKHFLLLGIILFIATYALFALCILALNFIPYDLANTIFIFGVVLFFIGFNLHEPIMQTCASQFCKAHEKGAALGIFNSFGYAGSFIGGILGGTFFQFIGFEYLCGLLITLSFVWLILLFTLKNPSEFKNLYLPLNVAINSDEIRKVFGVIELYKNSTNLVIKFDSKLITQEKIKEIIKA